MRLENYLQEQVVKDPSEVLETIKKDCKPYLRESKNSVIFRGSKKVFERLMAKLTPRQDRRPLGTEEDWHSFADSYFQDKFGWKARSQGVFATKDWNTASVFGNLYLFFPIGNFKYLWSPKVNDFTFDVATYNFEIFKRKPQWRERTLSQMETYTDKNLHKAISEYPKNEIIFKCSKYYMVRPEILKQIEQGLK